MSRAASGCSQPQRGSGTLSRYWIALAVVVSVGCQDHSEPVTNPTLSPTIMTSIVTGNAAAALDESGYFRLDGPPASGPRQLTLKEAEALAAVWPRQFGVWARPTLEHERGGAIAMVALKVCGRTLYAESPFEPLDPTLTADPMIAVVQRVYGAWWLVTLCGATGAAEVSLAVSAYATDLAIKDGQIIGPPLGGEWFSPEGIPIAGEDFILSPERAAERVATKTHRKIREVPRLIIPARPQAFPNHAYWSLRLDAGTKVKPDGKPEREEDRLYLGRRPTDRSSTLMAAASGQPQDFPVFYRKNIRVGAPVRPPEYGTIRAVRKADFPIVFEPVSLPAAR